MTTETGIPTWRASARAGVPLAAVMPKATAPIQPAQAALLPGDSKPDLFYILPSARDRWMASNLHYYKPAIVENTIRSAMSGDLTAQWLMFDLMEQTWPRLNKNLNELKDAIVDLDWSLEAFAPKGQKPSPEALRRAQIVEQILWDMAPNPAANENDFDDTLRDVMDAVGKGISILEIDWEQKNIALDLKGTAKLATQTVWKPRATHWVHPRYYGYPAFGQGNDRLMLKTREITAENKTLKFDADWIDFPPDNFLISIIKQKSGHPLSGALLRILGYFWAAQNFAWEWFLNFAQIFGSPFRWATYDPTNKSLLPLIMKMMAQMGSMGYAAFPEGTKVEFKDAVQNGRDNPQKILIDCSDQIADIMILGQTLTTTQGERGSQALGNIHKTVRDEKIHALGKRVGKTINGQLLRSICRRNFGDDTECPYLIIPSDEEGSAIEKAQRDKIVIDTGVPVSAQWYRNRHGIPAPEPGEELVTPPAVATPGEPPLPGNDPRTATARARGVAALETLTDNVLENVTGVQAKWLDSVRPAFSELVASAKNGEVSDEQFIRTLQAAQKKFPELFSRIDTAALAQAMEKAMGAAAVNGAVSGMMQRRAQ